MRLRCSLSLPSLGLLQDPRANSSAPAHRAAAGWQCFSETNDPVSNQITAELGVVVIGRNEGKRLRRCLRSLRAAEMVIYVDSGSTDGSPEWVRAQRAEVVALDMTTPFTAARARNAGWRRLREMAPYCRYVQFVDGDCEM